MTDRRVYLPRMADHALAVAAAMRHFEIEARALPPPDAESMAIGLDLCRGRECLPCFLCVGDMVRQTRQPGFEPARAVFFMPTGPGPCRFGQYRMLERDVLDDLGCAAAQVVSPDAASSYELFGRDPSALRKLVWQGIAAVDLLTQLLHEHRPYEATAGACDAVYADGLARVEAATEAGGGSALVAALRAATARFLEVPIDRRERRPLIGVVGELYVMLNTWSNREVVRQVEVAGGEVRQSTFMDWLNFTAWTRRTNDWALGEYRDWVSALLVGFYQDGRARRLRRAAEKGLRHPEEAPMDTIMEALAPHYDPALGTEGVVTMARAMDFARSGASGILNILPFSCMPGIVVGAMAPRLRMSLGGIPWLDLSYDGQEQTHLGTRLEAFMHQAREFSARAA